MYSKMYGVGLVTPNVALVREVSSNYAVHQTETTLLEDVHTMRVQNK